MTRVYLDIETIPTTSPDEMARIAAAVLEHNASLKKPHADDEVKRLTDEAHRKTALDGAVGEIVCISVAIDAGPVCSWSRDWRAAGSEADLLARFRADMHDALDGRGAILVGHNVAFDRGFLRKRSLVLGVSLPSWMTRTPKWKEDAVSCDTMLLWTDGAYGEKIGLDRLARSLGLDGKTTDLDGSKVWDAVLAGRIEDVVAYCERDVDLTRRCFHRMSATAGAEAHQ